MGQIVLGDKPNILARSIWLWDISFNANSPTLIQINTLMASVKILGLKEILPCSD
tara:strand:+ start:326 stop:490 length:165 start_codon:yes stop_codon:yes gene_type:complete